MVGDRDDADAAIRRDAIDHGVRESLADPAPPTTRHWRSGVWAKRQQRRDPSHLGDKLVAQLRHARGVVLGRITGFRERVAVEREALYRGRQWPRSR